MKGACDEEASLEKALWTDKRDQKHEVWGREKEARLVEGRAVREMRRRGTLGDGKKQEN